MGFSDAGGLDRLASLVGISIRAVLLQDAAGTHPPKQMYMLDGQDVTEGLADALEVSAAAAAGLSLFADHGCSRSLTRQALHRREVLNTLITENIADFTLSGVLHWPVCPQPGSSPLIMTVAAQLVPTPTLAWLTMLHGDEGCYTEQLRCNRLELWKRHNHATCPEGP